MKKQAACPGCGAPVTFNVSSSKVVICESCGAIVARTDLKIEEIGKIAAIADSTSPLKIGLEGKFNGKSFTLTGRVQYRHQAGGVWDEWYAALSNGKWGWLAEAQGRFYMTFEQKAPKLLPEFERLQLGEAITASLTVGEKGIATAIAAEGEIPYAFKAGEAYKYADLSSPDGAVANIDYSASPFPLFYFGRVVTLDELGIDSIKHGPGRAPSGVSSQKVSCPNCGGALELAAPDQAQRVVCQYCKAMLDVNQGNLKYMETLKPLREPYIPIGSLGEWQGEVMTNIGFMVRSTVVEGETYYWEEYLLYNPQVGYRWLVLDEDAWKFVTPVEPGQVKDSGNSASYKGSSYSQTQHSTGRVEYVLGEFYWKVSVGETVVMQDFEGRLTKESSQYSGNSGGEVNWSSAKEVTHKEVCQKFGLPYTPGADGCPTWLVVLAIVVMVIVLLIWISSCDSMPSGGGSGGRSSIWFGGGGGGFGGGK